MMLAVGRRSLTGMRLLTLILAAMGDTFFIAPVVICLAVIALVAWKANKENSRRVPENNC